MTLKEGKLEDYKKGHDEVWPEITKALNNAGITNYSIYYDKKDNALFEYMELKDKNTFDQVSRINLKTKKIDFNIKIPAFNITSVSFVGKELRHIFVTSAKIETSKTQLQEHKHSGSSFIIKTNYKGLKIPYSNLRIK